LALKLFNQSHFAGSVKIHQHPHLTEQQRAIFLEVSEGMTATFRHPEAVLDLREQVATQPLPVVQVSVAALLEEEL